jgi:ribonuclease D
MDHEWIDTEAALNELCAHLRAQPFVAVDTEFHRERTFFAQLALVQVASMERVACIDPLAGMDLTPLDELMLDPGVVKVMHASRQDLEVFYDRTAKIPAPLFDTQVAAALLGHGDQLAYAALVYEVIGVELSKLHGRTDWMRRPLDPAVLDYAAGDVLHLRHVYLALHEELERLGRRAWLDEEQAVLLREATYRVPAAVAWTRVKGAGRLSGVECAVAQRIAAWREERARQVDRPRRRVLSDEVIVDLARQRPTSVQALERLRALEPDVRKRHGAELVELVRLATELPPAAWPASLDRGPLAAVDPGLLDALSAVLSACGRAADVSPRVLASRGDLERIAAGERELPVLAGWRGTIAGDAMQAFLAGRLRLEVCGGELRLASDDVP